MATTAELLIRAKLVQHDNEVARLATQQLAIADAIAALVTLYAKTYSVSARLINCGLCEDFANDLCVIVPGAEARWGDELDDSNDAAECWAYHCVTVYEGRFYDSEYPFGVDDFREMSAFGYA